MPRLTTAQAAARLGIKPATLYSYVARGLIGSLRSESAGSTFDPLDVEALASAHRRGARRANDGIEPSGRPLMVVDSALTLVEPDRLLYRGVPATELAERFGFAEAVEFVWGSGVTGTGFGVSQELERRVIRAAGLLGTSSRAIERLELGVILAASSDPMRDELSTPSVHAAGRTMIGAMVGALELLRAPADHDDRLVARLWDRLSSRVPTSADLGLLDAALVLCLDHDLAAATMAARVAASARAHPYAAVLAALGAFDSPLHGSASIAAADLIVDALAGGNAERALAERVGVGSAIPGFGHVIYRDRDPRAEALFRHMRAIPTFHPVMRTVDRLAAIVAARAPRPANLDLALGALAVGAEMSRDAGQLVFAIGRTAGWIAHIVEEYAQPALRLRPESRYTGTRLER